MNFFVDKSTVTKYLIIIYYSLFALFLMNTTENMLLDIILMWGLCIIAIFMCNFDLAHPYFWFSALFSLYSLAYAMNNYMGYGREWGYDSENTILSYVALVVVLLIVSPEKADEHPFKQKETVLNVNQLKFIIYALSFLTIIAAVVLNLRGYSSKVDMKSAGDIFYRTGVYFARYLCMFLIVFLCDRLKKESPFYKKEVLISGIAEVLFSLFTGERCHVSLFYSNRNYTNSVQNNKT